MVSRFKLSYDAKLGIVGVADGRDRAILQSAPTAAQEVIVECARRIRRTSSRESFLHLVGDSVLMLVGMFAVRREQNKLRFR